MDNSSLHRAVMRRIYYAYAISITLHPMMWRGVFLGAAAVLLAQWLHVASIFKNFLSVPVGIVPQYIGSTVVNAATHGEMIVVLTLMAAGVVGLSALYQILHSLHVERFFTHSF
jgi:hypothetical protein